MSKPIKKGRFSSAEDDFILKNTDSMTDKQIADSLGRTTKSVTNRRTKLNVPTKRDKPKLTSSHRDAYISSLEEKEKNEFFRKEILSSARFKAIKDSFCQKEVDYYIEKYVDFMMDSTIETMTAMEKDALHQLIVSEIRVNRYLQEEKDDSARALTEKRMPMSRAREIRECQEVIMKCQASLNVERKQRLKNQSDQSITFTNLIKDMKNPGIRARLGREAAMLKYIAEKTYNHLYDNKALRSGKEQDFVLEKNFKDEEDPSLSADFLPEVKDE